MNQEDVQKLSNAANAKITLLKNDFFKYFSAGDHGRVLYCSCNDLFQCCGKCVLRGRRTGMGEIPGGTRVLDCGIADFAGRRRAFYRK